jgi:tetratricopeptide (TPR) repeat protein
MKHISVYALAAAVACVTVIGYAASGALGWQSAPAPFVWRDVALVCFLAALPLAASLTALMVRTSRLDQQFAAVVAVEAIVLVLVPWLYIEARLRNDTVRVAGLVEQSRFGEARELVTRLLILGPNASWKGRPLREAAFHLDAVVRGIEQRVAAPVASDATAEDRLRRSRDLAMLGDTSMAIAMIQQSPSLADTPEACNLLGTVYETRGEFSAGRDWYGRARRAWQSRGDSPERTAGLVQAMTGVGYCERKLGRLQEAEAAYQERLALLPTAESHFLLAQFYEDTQQTAKAREHARQATKLDPRYERSAQQLIDKLATVHFGCWGLFK